MIRFALTLAAAACLATAPALADGRADWREYAWQTIHIADCVAAGPVRVCPPYHQKWDWKRNQWVDILVTLDSALGEVHITQRLTDNDRSDDDHVCVTALVLDAGGRDLVAHHQNWAIGPGDVLEKAFPYRTAALSQARTIDIGSKQCREGAGQDDAVYAAVLAAIAR